MWAGSSSRNRRIAIVGVGQVGGAVAYALILQTLASEILLVDEDIERRDGQVRDLSDVSYGHGSQTRVRSATHREAGQCDIVVITAGSKYTLGQTRVEHLHRNVSIIRQVIDEILPFKADSILIVVSNPVDLLTSIAQTLSGLPSCQVLGSGTFLDSVRLRGLVAHNLEVATNSIGIYILGVEGDAQVVAWSAATVGALPMHEFRPPKGSLDPVELESSCRNRSKEIIRAKGSCPFGLGSVPEFGCCFSMPAVLGRTGITRTIKPPMSPKEEASIMESAEILRTTIDRLNEN